MMRCLFAESSILDFRCKHHSHVILLLRDHVCMCPWKDCSWSACPCLREFWCLFQENLLLIVFVSCIWLLGRIFVFLSILFIYLFIFISSHGCLPPMSLWNRYSFSACSWEFASLHCFNKCVVCDFFLFFLVLWCTDVHHFVMYLWYMSLFTLFFIRRFLFTCIQDRSQHALRMWVLFGYYF